MTKGAVKWRPDGIHWFVVVEDVEQHPVRNSTSGLSKPRGTRVYQVVELVHPKNPKMRAVGEKTKNLAEAIANADALNGDMHIYYMEKGAFIDMSGVAHVQGYYGDSK